MPVIFFGALIVRFWRLNCNPRMTGIGAHSSHNAMKEFRGRHR